ncbi:hemerythrin domain-containing protein [Microbacterium sp. NEAU-LLC]|uniref:Hemerythrin domain-containing protein n=1 Tax=Microbacterium helvum TaxID=2773713 RepID=A0ABR8NT73_9MICO|nr:hemerythrin domain-containing protein [Microbacterium helvum]MBD3943810.1 hemerythrin domain-containing protein [Microbacterium helvum]
MSDDDERTRVIAWAAELRRAHSRLRDALQAVRDALQDGADVPTASRELVLYCRGFCTALDQHHRGEDRALFPAIEAEHPELAPVLRRLEQDHSMIDVLLTALSSAADDGAAADEIGRHLDGVGAIMASHFAYEERQLLQVLETLGLQADPDEVLGRL